MKRIFENGRCNDENARKYLGKWGFTYEVKEEIVADDGKHYYIIDDDAVPVGVVFDPDWFMVVPVFLAKSRKIPEVGASVKDFLISEKLNWVPCTEDERILKVVHSGGNVYEVYTKFKTYNVEVF